MALKVVSISSELNVLRALVHKDRKIAGTVLSNCDESYFYTDESLEIFGAIKKYMAEYGTLPSYKLLMADTDISKKARKFFKKSEQVADSIDAAKKLLRNLQKYRQRRAIADLAENLVTAMSQEEKMNIDRTLDMASTAISNARAKKSNSDAFTHFGKNNNSRKIIQDILWGNREDSLIPTGIDIYDQEAGGWPRGGLVTIGANSGGGKSVLASAVAVKMVSAGYKVLLVPLEMSVEEMTCRIIANVTKTNLTKLMTQDLTENEKREIDRKFTKWLKKVKKKGGQYTLFKPEEDLTLEEVYAATGAYDYDVSIVDYVTLLAEMDGDDQWRKIGAAGRFAKIDAENRKRVNVLLAQVNDEGKIRYSRALTEHSNVSWTWIADAEAKETGIIRIEQPKSRNSRAFPFFVRMVYEFMRVENLDQEQFGGLDSSGDGGLSGDDEDPKPKKNKKQQKEKKKERDKRNGVSSVPNLSDV